MTEQLIQNHNARVGKGDIVYHLGDMFWRTLGLKEALNIRHRLNGQHYYILGNHEELMDKYQTLRERFVWVRDLATIPPQDAQAHPQITLCHYAMRVWPRSHKGTWHLYGHSHGELKESGTRSFDVGVDACGYAPISIEEVRQKMERKNGVVEG